MVSLECILGGLGFFCLFNKEKRERLIFGSQPVSFNEMTCVGN